MSRVRLVGIGPGHPGLATVQAVEAIKDAEIIRCCDGCGTGLLHLASAQADIGPLESAEEIVRLPKSSVAVMVAAPDFSTWLRRRRISGRSNRRRR